MLPPRLVDTKTTYSSTTGISNYKLNTGLDDANSARSFNTASQDRNTSRKKLSNRVEQYRYYIDKPQQLTAQKQIPLELTAIQHRTRSKGITCAYQCCFQLHGKRLLVWLTLVSTSVLYNLWLTIARQAFADLQKQYNNWWIAADTFADVIYLMDIVVQLNTPQLEQGLIIQDKRKSAVRYMHTRYFALDLLTLVPLDLIQCLAGIQPMLRFPRFLKIYRTLQWKDRIKHQSKYPNVLRVIIRMHILLLGCHWFACFYFIISTQQNFSTKWGYRQSNNSDVTTGRAYLIAFYWVTVSLMTIQIENAPTTAVE
ncbi:cyclic nucleotide gated channel alpha 2 [Paragonimus westermani]|uniref:Cyclic nucleotide gated channel alpha 2 n=1 Tax=Paragonimus westermani TaxID=34504 RepID=A0A5J4NFT0_9TREM|nr:cyclic nucleotide gated channel alpha 2 [Paragonimus westermani]